MTDPTDPPLMPGAELPEQPDQNAPDQNTDEEQLIEEGPAPDSLDTQTPFERPDPTEAPLPAERVEELTGEDEP